MQPFSKRYNRFIIGLVDTLMPQGFDVSDNAPSTLHDVDAYWVRHGRLCVWSGASDAIDAVALQRLVEANAGKRGFTYTHKPVLGEGIEALNREAVADANANGFTINLSANNLAHADALADLAIGPVVVIQDAHEGDRADTVTPAGRKVATCPATYRDDVTCATCGLCQRRDRKVIVGFPAHGMRAKAAAAIARG